MVGGAEASCESIEGTAASGASLEGTFAGCESLGASVIGGVSLGGVSLGGILAGCESLGAAATGGMSLEGAGAFMVVVGSIDKEGSVVASVSFGDCKSFVRGGDPELFVDSTASLVAAVFSEESVSSSVSESVVDKVSN